jgi:hypothetical protein
VTAFADSQPGASLIHLADQLGTGDVAAVQLEWRLIDEAETTGSMERCARSLLARALREDLPEGWQHEWRDVPGDPSTPLFRKVGALVSLIVAMPDRYKPCAERVCDALNAAEIPVGWLPSDADDALLVEVFRRHWPAPAVGSSSGGAT